MAVYGAVPWGGNACLTWDSRGLSHAAVRLGRERPGAARTPTQVRRKAQAVLAALSPYMTGA